MSFPGLGKLITLILFPVALVSCATAPPVQRTAETDPAPFVKYLKERFAQFDQGLSATVDLDFQNEDRYQGGIAYMVLQPSGRFRLEVPGPMGSTLLVAACDGQRFQVYYPEEAAAFQGSALDAGMWARMPFSLPVRPVDFAFLITGTPPVERAAAAPAYLNSDGTRILTIEGILADTITMDFGGRRNASHPYPDHMLSRLGDASFKVTNRREHPHYPEQFSLRRDGLSLSGRFDRIAPAKELRDEMFRIDLPDGVVFREMGEPS
jgi:hypothetical protein